MKQPTSWQHASDLKFSIPNLTLVLVLYQAITFTCCSGQTIISHYCYCIDNTPILADTRTGGSTRSGSRPVSGRRSVFVYSSLKVLIPTSRIQTATPCCTCSSSTIKRYTAFQHGKTSVVLSSFPPTIYLFEGHIHDDNQKVSFVVAWKRIRKRHRFQMGSQRIHFFVHTDQLLHSHSM